MTAAEKEGVEVGGIHVWHASCTVFVRDNASLSQHGNYRRFGKRCPIVVCVLATGVCVCVCVDLYSLGIPFMTHLSVPTTKPSVRSAS